MELSKRLSAVASYVLPCNSLADIGTDHAYIPVYLIKKGIIKKAIATDISKGSIEKARKNAERYNCIDVIDLKCGDGLSVINQNEQPDTIVIAGMGGMLAIDVMKKNIPVVKGVKRLIVQPQRDIDKVRRFIHEIGFKIITEKMLIEDNKFYDIIVCENGEDKPYSDKEYLFGKNLIEEKNPVLKEYIAFEMNKMKKVLTSLESNLKNNELPDIELSHIVERKNQVFEKYKCFEEVYLCL